MRENSATVLPDLVIECPNCAATGWVTAVESTDLTIACPVCGGRSWVSAVAS